MQNKMLHSWCWLEQHPSVRILVTPSSKVLLHKGNMLSQSFHLVPGDSRKVWNFPINQFVADCLLHIWKRKVIIKGFFIMEAFNFQTTFIRNWIASGGNRIFWRGVLRRGTRSNNLYTAKGNSQKPWIHEIRHLTSIHVVEWMTMKFNETEDFKEHFFSGWFTFLINN